MRKGLIALGIFLALVAGMTAVSRAYYKLRLPVVTAEYPERNEKNDVLIPRSALRVDESGYFVLCLREGDSALGYGYAAGRVSVDLLEAGEEFCAVFGLPEDELVIVDAAGEIADGSRVRFFDGQ